MNVCLTLPSSTPLPVSIEQALVSLLKHPNDTLWRLDMSPSALVGYARTSTTDHKAALEAKLRDLEASGCTKIFHEELSSISTKRPQLEAALDYVREADTLIVTKVDRLARSVADLVGITDQLRRKDVHLRFLSNPELNTEALMASSC